MRRAAIALLLIPLPLAAALADVYRSVDAQGHVQYSDTPTPGAQLVSSAELSEPLAQAGRSAPADNGATDKAANQQLSQQAAARAVAKDTADAHAQQCKQAQDAYQKSIQARRLYTTGADGQRQYLSDAQADQQRVSYRLAMETACEDSADSSDAPASSSSP